MNPSLQDNAIAFDLLRPDLQEQLSQILEEYLSDLEEGVRPEPAELIAAHPDLAEPLAQYLESLDFLHNATGKLGAEPARDATDGLPPRQLGDFRIKREIGRGGMGVVYEAEQISIGRKVALKVLPFAAVLDQKQIARFNNEAQAAGQLNHRHIVPVYSVGCERGVHYYSMQLIEGQPLDRAIEDLRGRAGNFTKSQIAHALAPTKAELTQGPTASKGSRSSAPEPRAYPLDEASHFPAFSPRTEEGFSTARSIKSRNHMRAAADLAIQAAEAIHHAHEYGIIHRDIKPSNLLIDKQGNLWVTDFGLARCREGNNITMTGDLLGTLRYMSPEQATGRGNLVDHRADIYALGVTLYELLTLQLPFDGPDPPTLLRQLERSDPLPPRRLNYSIPVDLETIVLKAISKSREDRYESAQAMADDLRFFLDGKPPLATRPSLLDRATKWAGRHSKFVASVAGVLLLALFGSVIAALLIAREKDKTEAALNESRDSFALSQANLHQAINVVDRFGMRLANELSEVPGMEGLRRALLVETLQDYEGFVEQLQHNAEMRFALALSHSHMGTLHEQLGQIDEALIEYGRAKVLYEVLAAEQPEEGRFRHDLAICHNNVGDIFFQKGDIPRARSAYDEALYVQRVLVTEAPEEAPYTNALAATLVNVGNLQRATNQIQQARQTYDEAVSLQQQLCERHPQDAKYQRELAVSYAQLSFLNPTEDLEQAEYYNSEALAIHKRLLALDSSGVKPLSDLATCYNHRGAIFSKHDRIADAMEAYEAATALQERLVQRAPTIVHYQEELAVSYNNLGQMLVASSRDKAKARFDQANAILTSLVQVAPDSPRYRAQQGGVLANLGPLLEEEHPADARAAYEQAIEYQTSALELAPQIIDFRIWLSSSYVKYGRFLRQRNEPVAAAEVALMRRALWEGNGGRLQRVAVELAESASMLSEQSSPDSARWINEAISTLEEAVAAGFDNREELVTNTSFRVLADHSRFKTLLAALPAESPRSER